MSNRKRNFTITKLDDNENIEIIDFNNTINFENENNLTTDTEELNCKIHISQYINDIDTIVIKSRNIYTLCVLGLIDKMIYKYNFKIENIKNYISSSFGTLISVYLSFGYSPKEILLIFFERLKLNGNILNITNSYGIFELDGFIDELLKPLFERLGYIPTLFDIYKNTGKNVIFLSYNLSLHKTVYFDHKNNPNNKIDTLVKVCCNIPIIFTKYLVDDNLYIDYTFISNNIEDKLYDTILYQNNDNSNKYKRFVFDTSILKKTYNDVKNMNISEYIFYIFEMLSNEEKNKKHPNENEINITIDTYNYDITLFLDNTQRHIELIKLYNCGFDKDCDFINIQNRINNNKYTQNKNKLDHFEGVVFAGGGVNIGIILGMYKYIYENNMILKKDTKVLIGTSAGSMLSALLSIGFEPIDTMKFFFEFKLSENIQNSLKNISITESIQNKGMINNKILLNYLENILTKYNNGIIPTLLDIKNKYDKELVCVTYNITKNKLEYLDYKNSPDLLITYACVMSSCIPIVFNPFEYKNNLYLDGCICSNFPIEHASEYKDINFACFGFDNKIKSSPNNILEYLMKIFYEKLNINENEKMDLDIGNCEYFIYTGDRNCNPLITDEKEAFNIYSNGYKYIMENYILK